MTSRRSHALLGVVFLLVLGTSHGQVYIPGPAVTAVAADLEPAAAAPASSRVAVEEPVPAGGGFTTQTVYGFLDFTTTIANTVMVFSPQSAPPLDSGERDSKTPIETKPTIEKKPTEIKPSKTIKSSGDGTTKKQRDNAKIIVNSVIDQKPAEQKTVLQHAEKPTMTRVEVVTQSTPALSSVIEVRSKPVEEAPAIRGNLAEPEYDFLARAAAEIVEETYKVINLRPSAKPLQKPRPSSPRNKENPTGLVTKLGGTIVKDGLTTVHETSVIGTYINGKYAQVLQSSSRVLNPADEPEAANKIKPTASQRILKTIGPQGKLKHQTQPPTTLRELEPTTPLPDEQPTEPQGLLGGGGGGGGRPGQRRHQQPVRTKFRNKIVDENAGGGEGTEQPPAIRPKLRPGNAARPGGYKNRPQSGTTTTTTEAPGTRRRFRPSASNNSPSNNNNNNGESAPTKKYKPFKTPEQQQQQHHQQQLSQSNPSVKAKLPRTQGRWSYKTTPKPRINIRKTAGDDDVPAGKGPQVQVSPEQVPTSVAPVVTVQGPQGETEPTPIQRKEGDFDGELEEGESEDSVNVQVQQQQQLQPGEGGAEEPPQPTQKILPIETLNVEISTPADFNDIYFEIATMKSPYEFQVGSTRNTRYVTVTSTIKKSFATAEASPTPSVSPTEPLTENILANTGAAYETTLPLDSSIATLPAITLEPSQATPPLETITETFSTTQTLLKTHLLPVISDNSTHRLTLVQTYNIARVVTATKTLPPPEIYQFVPSKTLKEFNSKLDEAGSELHLELDFGDDERDDEDIPKRIIAPSTDLDSDLDIFKHINHSNKHQHHKEPNPTSAIPTDPPMTPEQVQQLALLKLLGGQSQPQVITTSRPVVVFETVFDSHVIPLVNKGSTFFSTLTRPIATVPRTTYEYGTSTIAPILPPVPVPQVPTVPLFPPVQPQFTITSAPIVQQTMATVSDSKILKLTFGAKTAYTTLYSTRVVPTALTTFVTTTVPVQPTVAAFPGYYPPPPVPFPGYPYVG